MVQVCLKIRKVATDTFKTDSKRAIKKKKKNKKKTGDLIGNKLPGRVA